jgi:DNA-binding transcriptional LysR family regulator
MLDGEPFIMFSAQARYLHEKQAGLLAEARITPRIEQRMTHSQAILSFVSAGIGLAIVPGETRTACFDSVVLRPIDLRDACVAELHAIWRPDNRNRLLQDIRDVAARTGAHDGHPSGKSL